MTACMCLLVYLHTVHLTFLCDQLPSPPPSTLPPTHTSCPLSHAPLHCFRGQPQYESQLHLTSTATLRMPIHGQRLGLKTLQRYLQWRPPCHAKALVVSDVDETALVRWIQRSPSVMNRPKVPRTPVHREHCYQTQLSQRQQILAATCRTLQSEKSAVADREAAASSEVFLLNDSVNPKGSDAHVGNVYMLPFTLATLAAHVRQEKTLQLSSSATLLTASSITALQLEGKTTATPSVGEATSSSGLSAPHSKDCFIAEVTTLSPSRLGDAVTVAVHQLQRAGAFLLLSPQRFQVPHKTQDYLKWQFGTYQMGYLPGGSTFLFCSCLTGNESAPRLQQASFPGLMPRGVRRKRSWDRYGRNRDLYVANLSPHFGRAAVSKDLLEEDLRRRREQADIFDQRDNDFFGVSHDMVENSRYNTKPED